MKVLITGCSSGIGRSTACELTARGHVVIATARRLEGLDGLDTAESHQLDVTSQSSIEAVLSRVGVPDAVVNNAGIGVRGPIDGVSLEEVRRMFDTNFFGAARVMQAVLPAMRARRSGAVVNVTSMAAHYAIPLHGYYSASKFALLAATEAARIELGHFGVRVLAVAPGIVDTAFTNIEFGLDRPPYDELERMVQRSSAAIDEVNGGGQSPEIVARVIADAIESEDTKLVWPAGADAEMTIGVREAVDYARFERAMRDLMKLDW